jgi:hypothetical protein
MRRPYLISLAAKGLGLMQTITFSPADQGPSMACALM